eukprot:10795171-Alexandrium_andersonii.AAC.1
MSSRASRPNKRAVGSPRPSGFSAKQRNSPAWTPALDLAGGGRRRSGDERDPASACLREGRMG